MVSDEFTEQLARAAESALPRRAVLLENMAALGRQQINCGRCVGTCCTFVANSMQITPLEALDLIGFLREENRLTPSLRIELGTCARRFRLDIPPPGDGRRQWVRRTYTCPFFKGSANGCTIAPRAKPYGCLGFNPRQAGCREGEHCASDRALLRERESGHCASVLARAFDWEKLPIPIALSRVLDVCS